MRIALLAASAVLVLTAAAPAAAAPTVSSAVAQSAVTDAELEQFARAMAAVRPINAQVQNGAPTTEQQAAMVEAITGAGLEVERFNAIYAAVAADTVLQARVEVLSAPASPAGSVAAGVTDAELSQYAAAMAGVGPIAAALNGAAPSPEQQNQMVAAITASGLAVDRFNAIAGAAASDDRLRARVSLAIARGGA